MPISPYIGEVFVDSETGEWLGDFHGGDGPSGPFGWCKCLGFADSCAAANLGLVLRFFDTPPCCRYPSSGGRDTYIPAGGFPVQSMTTIPDDVAPAAWDSALTYEAGELVTYSGALYIAIWDVSSVGNINKQPDIFPLFWQPFDLTLAGSLAAFSSLVALPGASQCGFGWVGVQDEASEEWVVNGALVGDTGWHPQHGQCWKFSCWAKAIDIGVGSDAVERFDGSTYSDPDARLELGFGIPNSGFSPTDNFPLTMGEWVFCESTFTWVPGDTGPGHTIPFVYPIVGFGGNQLNQKIVVTEQVLGRDVTHPVRREIGHVLVRDLHLYPCFQFAGNWIDSFHGHG